MSLNCLINTPKKIGKYKSVPVSQPAKVEDEEHKNIGPNLTANEMIIYGKNSIHIKSDNSISHSNNIEKENNLNSKNNNSIFAKKQENAGKSQKTRLFYKKEEALNYLKEQNNRNELFLFRATKMLHRRRA